MLTSNDLKQISGIVKKETDPIKKSVAKIDKKLDFSIKFLDREYSKRIKRLEDHAHLSPLENF